MRPAASGFPRINLLKLSEKSRLPLQRSLTGHRNGAFRAVLTFVYWPNQRSKPRCDPFSDSFSETVRKVSEALPAEPNGSPRSGFSVHFALRIAAKSSLGLLLVPFSDSLSRQLGE